MKQYIGCSAVHMHPHKCKIIFKSEKNGLQDYRKKMPLSSNAAGPDNKPDNYKNEVIHTKAESG